MGQQLKEFRIEYIEMYEPRKKYTTTVKAFTKEMAKLIFFVTQYPKGIITNMEG